MRLTRRVPLKEQEQLSLPEHLSFSGVRVTRSLVSFVHFVDRFVCPFSFDHCVSFDLPILITALVSSNSS